jgi:predicted nucleic acid-binding protein
MAAMAAPNFLTSSLSKDTSSHVARSTSRKLCGTPAWRRDQDRSFHRQPGIFAGDPAIARQAGLLRRDWQKKGQTLSYTDVTIAAVALSNRAPLLTDNLKHFPMPELLIVAMPPT